MGTIVTGPSLEGAYMQGMDSRKRFPRDGHCAESKNGVTEERGWGCSSEEEIIGSQALNE